MVSSTEMYKIIFNVLENVELDNLEMLKKNVEGAIEDRDNVIEKLSDELTFVTSPDEEAFFLLRIRRVNDARKLLKARLTAIEDRIKEYDEEEDGECEEEEIIGMSMPLDSLRIYN